MNPDVYCIKFHYGGKFKIIRGKPVYDEGICELLPSVPLSQLSYGSIMDAAKKLGGRDKIVVVWYKKLGQSMLDGRTALLGEDDISEIIKARRKPNIIELWVTSSMPTFKMDPSFYSPRTKKASMTNPLISTPPKSTPITTTQTSNVVVEPPKTTTLKSTPSQTTCTETCLNLRRSPRNLSTGSPQTIQPTPTTATPSTGATSKPPTKPSKLPWWKNSRIARETTLEGKSLSGVDNGQSDKSEGDKSVKDKGQQVDLDIGGEKGKDKLVVGGKEKDKVVVNEKENDKVVIGDRGKGKVNVGDRGKGKAVVGVKGKGKTIVGDKGKGKQVVIEKKQSVSDKKTGRGKQSASDKKTTSRDKQSVDIPSDCEDELEDELYIDEESELDDSDVDFQLGEDDLREDDLFETNNEDAVTDNLDIIPLNLGENEGNVLLNNRFVGDDNDVDDDVVGGGSDIESDQDDLRSVEGSDGEEFEYPVFNPEVDFLKNVQ